MDSMPDGHVIVTLDFTNTFNCKHRDFLLKRVAEECPEIYRFCFLSYSHHSTLQFGDFFISSQSGSQQGDPLGGLLFYLAIHSTLLSLSTPPPLSVRFMDDITIGGARSTVASDVDQFDLELQEVVNTHSDDACLLGAPLGSSGLSTTP